MSNRAKKPLRERPFGIEHDPCDDKTWEARRKLARAVGLAFGDIDGVFFSPEIRRLRTFDDKPMRQLVGYLYNDRKGRFSHGWKIYSSRVEKVSGMKESERVIASGTITLPEGTKIVKTLYSRYIMIPS